VSAGLVIVGASHAGIALAAELRAADFRPAITLISDETAEPYHRPHLSKECLEADVPPGLLKPAAFYAEKAMVRLGAGVVAIHSSRRRIEMTGGKMLDYETLILATGARARTLPAGLPGAELALTLRNLDDLQRLRARLASARRLVIIGGGLIGLEMAAAARTKGISVDVVECADRLMSRSLSPELAALVRERHAAAGITFHIGSKVRSVTEERVELEDGAVILADLVVASVGNQPRSELAEAAVLACDDGIIVEFDCATSLPGIFAIADCARWPEPGLARGVRHESIAPLSGRRSWLRSD